MALPTEPVSAIGAFFHKKYRNTTCLVPLHNGSKQPCVRFAGIKWKWPQWIDWSESGRPVHGLGLLLWASDGNEAVPAVIDCDSPEACQEVEARFPQLAEAPMAKTANGNHYWVLSKNPNLVTFETSKTKKIDFKGGYAQKTNDPASPCVVVLPPTPGKQWIRHPSEHEMKLMSHELEDFLKELQGSYARREHDACPRQQHRKRLVVEEGEREVVPLPKLKAMLVELKQDRLERRRWLPILSSAGKVSRDNGYEEEGLELVLQFSEEGGDYPRAQHEQSVRKTFGFSAPISFGFLKRRLAEVNRAAHFDLFPGEPIWHRGRMCYEEELNTDGSLRSEYGFWEPDSWEEEVLSLRDPNDWSVAKLAQRIERWDETRALSHLLGFGKRYFAPNEHGIWGEYEHPLAPVDVGVSRFLGRFNAVVEKHMRQQNKLLAETTVNAEGRRKDVAFWKGIYEQLNGKVNISFTQQLHLAIESRARVRAYDTGKVKVHELFDQPTHLLPFRDGILDPNTMHFSADFEDNVHHRCVKNLGYDYRDVLKVTQAQRDEVDTIIKQILPKKTVRNYVFGRFCKALQAMIQVKGPFWTGGGANGKTLLLTLMLEVFGLFGTQLPANFLTKTRGQTSSSQADSAMMCLKGARLAVFTEPEANTPFDTARYRLVTGGDRISARDLKEKQEQFIFYGIMMCAMNGCPPLDSFDGGTRRRLEIVPCTSVFTDDPDLVDEANHVYPMKLNLANRFGELKYAGMELLLSYVGKEVVVPPEVLVATGEYADDQDPFKLFVSEFIVKDETQQRNKWLEYTEIDDHFKAFCAERGLEAPRNKKAVKAGFEGVLGKMAGTAGPEQPCYGKTGRRNFWRHYCTEEKQDWGVRRAAPDELER